MSKQATGIVCRLCSRVIETDSTLTYVTCVLCRDAVAMPLRAARRTEMSQRLTA